MSTVPEIEEKVLKFWKEREIFQKSLELRNPSTGGAKRFVFFEGPPTANNRPGIHHLVGRAYKDIFVRYKSMRGFLVERKAGWDTHGLPVEIEVEKALGLKNKKEIEAYGIAKFNTKAKESVWKYKDEWERFTERIGFWLDMHDPYITYDANYIESLWWVIKQIDDKKLLYRGHKVLPWCTRCGTALSSHEVAQGYEDITDTSVYVKFKVKNPGKLKTLNSKLQTDLYILAWTTTPWTLPGNLALAVGRDITYSAVRIDGVSELLILAKDLIEKVLTGHSVEVVHDDIKGKDLVGLEYEPLFEVGELKSSKSYKVYLADFVTTTDGTGVVHTAVMYGEDDYKLGEKLGLPKVHTVDEEGNFRSIVHSLADKYVKAKETEDIIIDYLKANNFLFKSEPYTHSYPHCWRCHTPLLYYAKDSWFVAMSKLQKQLLKNNRKVNWSPEHIRDGRFGEFLKEVKDWAFSRERYWGTPLPVWQCENCDSQRVIGSFEELEEYRCEPKNHFYLMRHGHSTKNGNSDGTDVLNSKLDHDTYELTDEGIKQVQQKAEWLSEQGGVDMIVSSPFLRAKQSAEIIAKMLGVDCVIDERLKELDHGLECEGKNYLKCPATGSGRSMDTRKHEDGETWREAKKRMFAVAKELNDKYRGKKILVVSHGDPLWLLSSTLRGWSDEKTIELRKPSYLQQGGLHELDFKNWPFDETGDLNPHRPYIDGITLKCEKCGGQSKRIKEVADVWFDSGAMPFAQWHYPFDNAQGKPFENNFPADFITEAIDQTRGWFYTLLAVSTLLGRGNPYKNVLCYSHVLDSKGRKMSKSLGNTVDPNKVIEEYGADAARWYFYSVNSPGDNKLFAFPESMRQPKAFLGTILNSLNFFELYNKLGRNHLKSKPKPQSMLDQWILSRFNSMLDKVTKALDSYDPTTASRAIESFVVDDLSNWWIRRSREQFQRPKNDKAFERSFSFLQSLLIELSKVMAPFTPFIAEHLYKKISNEKESVHLEDWPKVKKSAINAELEQEMAKTRELVTLGLSQRKTANLKVRQPLALVTFNRAEPFPIGIENIIKAELNVKHIAYDSTLGEPIHPVKSAGSGAQDEQFNRVKLDTTISHELLLEGYSRELMRQLQDMRKEAGYKVDDKAFAAWESENADVVTSFEKFGDEIKKTVLLKDLSQGHQENIANDIEKEFELTPGIKVWLGIRR